MITINKKIVLTYIENYKIYLFYGKIIKIKKNTFKVKKKNNNIYIFKSFFIKNPNLISLKIIK